MRTVLVISLAAVFIPAGCLVRETSKEKRLTQVEGETLTDEQLRANNARARKNAKAIVKNACGSVLHKSVWTETSDLGDGFFMYQTKHNKFAHIGRTTSCPVQYVSIDLSAALYMVKHNVSCAIDDKGLLRFNVPGQGEADAVKVSCETRLVDLTSSRDDELRIGTFEENGSIYTAQLSAQGSIASTNHFAGVSAEKLAELKLELGDEKLAADISMKDKSLTVAGMTAGGGLMGFTAGILTTLGSPTVVLAQVKAGIAGGKVIALAGIGGVVSYVAVPVGVAALAGTLIWNLNKRHQNYKQTVLVLREMLRQSLAG